MQANNKSFLLLLALAVGAPLRGMFDVCNGEGGVSSSAYISKVRLLAACEAKEALSDFSAGLLSTFDADAADMNCHSAALRVLLLRHAQLLGEKELIHTIHRIIKKLEEKTSLTSWFSLSPDQEFICLSHFVTKYFCKNPKKGRLKLKRLCSVYDIPFKKAKQLVEEARKKLNSHNNKFIHSVVQRLWNDQPELLYAFSQQEEKEGIITFPAYYAFQAIFSLLKEYKIPYILKLKVVCPCHYSEKKPAVHEVNIEYRVEQGEYVWMNAENMLLPAKDYYGSMALRDEKGIIGMLPGEGIRDKLAQLPLQELKECASCHQKIEVLLPTLSLAEVWHAQAAGHPQFCTAASLDFSRLGSLEEKIRAEFGLYCQINKDKGYESYKSLGLVHDFPVGREEVKQ